MTKRPDIDASPAKTRYFLSLAGREFEVTRDEWIAAERAAGFRSKFGEGEEATAGFSNGSVSGRIEHEVADAVSQK